MRILAIETSCDDTGIAILEYGKTKKPKLLADLVSSQVKIHAPWGGVVPMLAKREHQNNLTPLLIKALKKVKLLKISKSKFLISKQIPNSKIQTVKEILNREPELAQKLIPFLQKYRKPDIDYIAVTVGPGLEPALWTGVNFARALSYFWKIPIIPINHIEGHIAAGFSAVGGITNFQFPISKKYFPIICLVVSGGHTQIVLMKKPRPPARDSHKIAPFAYRIIGETRDDAAGEAFDKVAKMLNLGYPGGPVISQITKNYKLMTKDFFLLPRPMIGSNNFDFSFSGLKTAVLYSLQKMSKARIKKQTPLIATQFQQAVVDVLTAKTIKAAKKLNAKTILLAGGVASNPLLRDTLSLKTNELALNFLVPQPNLCADNAVMIALAAYWQIQQRRTAKISWRDLKTQANFRLS